MVFPTYKFTKQAVGLFTENEWVKRSALMTGKSVKHLKYNYIKLNNNKLQNNKGIDFLEQIHICLSHIISFSYMLLK